MDNKQFTDRLSKSLSRSKAHTGQLLAALSSVITEQLAEMNSVAVPGFGTLTPVMHNEEVVTDDNGTRTLMPPEVSLVFEPSSLLIKSIAAKKDKQ